MPAYTCQRVPVKIDTFPQKQGPAKDRAVLSYKSLQHPKLRGKKRHVDEYLCRKVMNNLLPVGAKRDQISARNASIKRMMEDQRPL